jgi:3-oxoacyl-(acyl-carrier-protein) synthase
MIAGGTEQPLSPYAWLCCETGNFLTAAGNDHPETAYRPFDRRHSGTVAGEGSVFLVLEDLEHARRRGAPVLAELLGAVVSTDGYQPYYTQEPRGETLARTIASALDRASCRPDELSCVLADGSAVPREDAAEVAALRSALGRSRDEVPVTAAKAAVGHLFGAAAVGDVAVAIDVLTQRLVPPIANLDHPAPGFDLDFVVGTPRARPGAGPVLVVSRGLGGVNACLVLGQPPPGSGPG